MGKLQGERLSHNGSQALAQAIAAGEHWHCAGYFAPFGATKGIGWS